MDRQGTRGRGRRGGAAALLALLLLAGPAAPQDDRGEKIGPFAPPPRRGGPPTSADAPLPERVGGAIEAGVKWLRGQVSVTGSFGELDPAASYSGTPDSYLYPAGPTALALYALLKSGVPADDPVVAKGFAWLREKQAIPSTSYEISMLVLALEARSAPRRKEPPRGAKRPPPVRLPSADAAWMKRLVEQLRRRREKRPGWRYNHARPADTGEILSSDAFGGDVDMSSTQVALLALDAADRCGVKVPDDLLLGTLRWVLAEQEEEGPPVAPPGADVSVAPDRARGWAYLPRARAPEGLRTGSMTASALATISLCSAILEERGNREYARTLETAADRAWRDGSAWFSRHWSIPRNPNGSTYYYYLYCLERAGDLRPANLLGGHDWFTEGARYLVDAQYPDGRWWGEGEPMPCDLLGTCFALLFLNRSARAGPMAVETK